MQTTNMFRIVPKGG